MMKLCVAALATLSLSKVLAPGNFYKECFVIALAMT